MAAQQSTQWQTLQSLADSTPDALLSRQQADHEQPLQQTAKHLP
jgi:hypothetical protein